MSHRLLHHGTMHGRRPAKMTHVHRPETQHFGQPVEAGYGPPGCVGLPTSWATDLSAEFAAIGAIEALLNSCMEPLDKLADADYQAASKRLGVDVEAIKAVAGVEDPKHDPINYQGRLTILFESQKFSKYSGGLYDKTNPEISSPRTGTYGKYRAQYDKLSKAYNLDPTAALKAASWGRFQLLGKNYNECGFSSVEEMVASLLKSERNQLDAFVRFLTNKNNKVMLEALKSHSWTIFAKKYNGPGQHKLHYDTKIKEAYEVEVIEASKGPPQPGKKLH